MKQKIRQIIADLEKQRTHIDKAIAALTEVAPGFTEIPSIASIAEVKQKKRNMSAEGRERIAAASRRRWAKVRKLAKQTKLAA